MRNLRHRDLPDRYNELTDRILSCAVEVHRILGGGLRETHYKQALQIEFDLRGIPWRREVGIGVDYKGRALSGPMYLDLVVADTVVVEAKSVEALHPAHESQLIAYLGASRYPLGLLINFGGVSLKGEIRRMLAPPVPRLRDSAPDPAGKGVAPPDRSL